MVLPPRRYWYAMIREIWCRCVRSCAAHVASNSDSVTVPNAGCRPRRCRSSAVSFMARRSLKPLRPRLREFVEQLLHRLALAVAHMSLPIERRKGLPFAGFQNHSRPRNPVLFLTVDQVRHHRTHAPCVLALVVLRPHLRQSAQQRVQSRRCPLKQCDRVFADSVPSKSPVPLFSSSRRLAPCLSDPCSLVPAFKQQRPEK